MGLSFTATGATTITLACQDNLGASPPDGFSTNLQDGEINAVQVSSLN